MWEIFKTPKIHAFFKNEVLLGSTLTRLMLSVVVAEHIASQMPSISSLENLLQASKVLRRGCAGNKIKEKSQHHGLLTIHPCCVAMVVS